MDASKLARLRTRLAFAAVIASAGLTYGRLFYGVDLTDEAFYIAVPFRFVLGAEPLVDETNLVQQTPGLLLYPLSRSGIGSWAWTGSFSTPATFTSSSPSASPHGFRPASPSARRRRCERPVAATAIVFVPFGIHGLSYNTFATGFFTVGCFLGAAWSGPATGNARCRRVRSGARRLHLPDVPLPVACSFARSTRGRSPLATGPGAGTRCRSRSERSRPCSSSCTEASARSRRSSSRPPTSATRAATSASSRTSSPSSGRASPQGVAAALLLAAAALRAVEAVGGLLPLAPAVAALPGGRPDVGLHDRVRDELRAPGTIRLPARARDSASAGAC